MSKQTISIIATLPSKPEKKEEMRKRLFQVADAMAREADFVQAWIHEDMNDPDTFVVYETWNCSREYFLANHLSKPYRTEYEAVLSQMLKQERRIDFLDGIRAYPKRVEA